MNYIVLCTKKVKQHVVAKVSHIRGAESREQITIQLTIQNNLTGLAVQFAMHFVLSGAATFSTVMCHRVAL